MPAFNNGCLTIGLVPTVQDRNFDDLFDRFAANIYKSLKGKIRLAVIRQDLEDFVPELEAGESLRILDAGGGLGVLTAELASRGHRLVYCDISLKMLQAAECQAQSLSLFNITSNFVMNQCNQYWREIKASN